MNVQKLLRTFAFITLVLAIAIPAGASPIGDVIDHQTQLFHGPGGDTFQTGPGAPTAPMFLGTPPGNGRPIYLARGLHRPLAEVWPELRHYDWRTPVRVIRMRLAHDLRVCECTVLKLSENGWEFLDRGDLRSYDVRSTRRLLWVVC